MCVWLLEAIVRLLIDITVSQILSLTAMKSTTPCFVKMMHELKYCKESVVCHVRCDNGDLSYMRI